MPIELGLIEPDQKRLWVYGLLGDRLPLCFDTCSPMLSPERRALLDLSQQAEPTWEQIGQLLRKA